MPSDIQIPNYIADAFENNNANEQITDASVFNIMDASECYCKIGSGFYPEDRINISYEINHCKEAFKEIINFNKDNGLPDNMKPDINQRTFKRSYKICI